MDLVRQFSDEMNTVLDGKLPVSRAKMASITRIALKAAKYYKHIVMTVEKFLSKCPPEYKVPGLYVIDSIVRQSRHQFGNEKDNFGPRFSKSFEKTFLYLFVCPSEDKPKIIRVLNLWQKNGVFSPEVIQPLLGLAPSPQESPRNPPEPPTIKQPPPAENKDKTTLDLDTANAVIQRQHSQIQALLQQQQQATTLLGPALQGLLAKAATNVDSDLASLLKQSQELAVAQELAAAQEAQKLTEVSWANGEPPPAQMSNSRPSNRDQHEEFNTALLDDFDYSDDDEPSREKRGSSVELMQPTKDSTDHLLEELQEQFIRQEAAKAEPFQLIRQEPPRAEPLQRIRQEPERAEPVQRIRREPTRAEPERAESLQRIRHEPARAEPLQLIRQEPERAEPFQLVRHEPARAEPLQRIRQEPVRAEPLQPPPPIPPPPQHYHRSRAPPLPIGPPHPFPPPDMPFPPPIMGGPVRPPLPPMDYDRRGPLPPSHPPHYPPPPHHSQRSPPSPFGGPGRRGYRSPPGGSMRPRRRSPSPMRRHSGSWRDRDKDRDLRSSWRRSRSPSYRDRTESRRSRSPSYRDRTESKRSHSPSYRDRTESRRSRSPSYRDRTESRTKMSPHRSPHRSPRRRSEDNDRQRKSGTLRKEKHVTVLSTTIWMGHLAKSVNKEQITEACSSHGSVHSVDVVSARGCAYVVMGSRPDAVKVLNVLKDVRLSGSVCKLAWAPGRGVKGGAYRNFWILDDGVSIIPWDAISSQNDLAKFADGGWIEPGTCPPGMNPPSPSINPPPPSMNAPPPCPPGIMNPPPPCPPGMNPPPPFPPGMNAPPPCPPGMNPPLPFPPGMNAPPPCPPGMNPPPPCPPGMNPPPFPPGMNPPFPPGMNPPLPPGMNPPPLCPPGVNPPEPIRGEAPQPPPVFMPSGLPPPVTTPQGMPPPSQAPTGVPTPLFQSPLFPTSNDHPQSSSNDAVDMQIASPPPEL